MKINAKITILGGKEGVTIVVRDDAQLGDGRK